MEMRMSRTASCIATAMMVFGLCGCSGGSSSRTIGNLSFDSLSTSPSPAMLSLLGRVTDSATGAGISAAALSIAGGPNDGRVATTDLGGNYFLPGLAASDFHLRVAAPPYAEQVTSVHLTDNQTLSFQLTRCTFTLSVHQPIDSTAGGGSFPVMVTTGNGCR